MSRTPAGVAQLGEVLTMIDRHSVPEERTVADGISVSIRVPKPLDRWKPAKVAKFKRMERNLKKLLGRMPIKLAPEITVTMTEGGGGGGAA